MHAKSRSALKGYIKSIQTIVYPSIMSVVVFYLILFNIVLQHNVILKFLVYYPFLELCVACMKKTHVFIVIF